MTMIAVIGCGNSNRCDDGVGSAVVQVLSARGLDARRVRLLDAGTDGIAVMFAARGCESLIVVDACRGGGEPGDIFDVPGAIVARDHAASFTLHDFRWNHALAAGRRMFGDDFPADVAVLLVEAATTEFGIGLSPPVAAAVTKVVERIETKLRAGPSP